MKTAKYRYENPCWEPYFSELSPFLSKIYFLTDNGHIKLFVSKLIFKKLSIKEQRIFNGKRWRLIDELVLPFSILIYSMPILTK